jgi:hypothetical protein
VRPRNALRELIDLSIEDKFIALARIEYWLECELAS